jgi:hypothetical protein
MMAFVLMAVAALVLDVGFAIVTRRQMQTATDSAALEGLRWRDAVPDPASADDTRRRNARDLLQRVFLDQDPPQPDDHRNFGAGPVVGFSDENAVDLGDGFKASETLSVPVEGADQGFNPAGYNPFDPDRPFQLNGYGTGESSNHRAGDMVSGTYQDGQPHTEAGDYSRQDFLPDTAAPSNTTPAGDTFLVRMRRSNEGQQADLGLSSGPSVPYLFGRGSLLASQLKGQGITVRAASIANARPVMSVGRHFSVGQDQFPGVTSFGLSYTYWKQFAQPKSNPPPPGTTIAQAQPSLGPGADGQYLAWPVGRLPSIGWSVATLPAPVNPPSPPDSTQTNNYVPIYDTVDGADRIIGFGLIRVVTNNPLKIDILSGAIASMNASVCLPEGIQDTTITGPIANDVIARNLALNRDATTVNDSIPRRLPVLLAPALVRSE